MTTLSVVVVGFGDEPDLPACLAGLRTQLAQGDDLALVDNGITTLPPLDGILLVTAPRNDGFGVGCNLGVAATSGAVLVFVNSDAVVEPGTIDALREAAMAPQVGLVTGLVVLKDAPGTVNSAGNPVHYLGISWAGGYGEPAVDHAETRDVASVSGALFATRREVWERLGGFDPSYFLYHEDTELSLRTHLSGLRVVYCPKAVARHAYSFDRNLQKMYLLERNRLVTVLTTYPPHLLRRLLPALVVTEPLLLVIALRDGWAAAKLRSWTWVLRNHRRIRERRRQVQAGVSAPHALDGVLATRLEQRQLRQPALLNLLNSLLSGYAALALGPRRRS